MSLQNLLNQGWQIHEVPPVAGVLLPPGWRNLHAEDRFRAQSGDEHLRISITLYKLSQPPLLEDAWAGLRQSWESVGFRFEGALSQGEKTIWQKAEAQEIAHVMGAAFLQGDPGAFIASIIFTEAESGALEKEGGNVGRIIESLMLQVRG